MIRSIKAARYGHDIRNASVKGLTLDSTKNQLKEFSSGSGTINLQKTGIGNVRKAVEITHNLGYQPFVRAWWKGSSGSLWSLVPASVIASSINFASGISRPDDNTLQLWFYSFQIFDPAFDEDFDYKYIIYIDPYKDAWST